MITKTRPSEVLKTEVKEERRLDWVKFRNLFAQVIFTLSALYAAHSMYIYLWRMATGH
jgi:hypothetical protein